ncbi:hypothetical protein HFZ63_001984, partial [Neisseria gonorrhoeae]
KPQPQQPTRPLSLWERASERATSRKACIWAAKVLGKIATIRRMPSPQPSPTGEGVGFGRFFGCRRFERQLRFAAVVSGRLKKDARNINSGNFSGSLYCQADGTNAASVFSDNL